MNRTFLIIAAVLSLTLGGMAQTRAAKTVTNADLSKFKEKRLDAEQDYRDNYARMGFPSPEELDRQRDEDMAARLQLAAELRQARLDKQRNELEARRIALDAERLEMDREAQQAAAAAAGEAQQGVWWGGYGYGYPSYGYWGRFPHHSPRPTYPSNRLLPAWGRQYYRVTPVGVTPAGTVIRPLIRSTVTFGGPGRGH